MPTSSRQLLDNTSNQGRLSPTASKWPRWYELWIQKQLDVVLALPIERSSLPDIFAQVTAVLRDGGSIDDIATSLLDSELIRVPYSESRVHASRGIAFAILGWQTMLYKPAFGICPPEQFAIEDVLDGYSGNAFMALRQDHSRVKRSVPDSMLGFGLMLPKGNLSLSEEKEDQQAFEKISLVDSKPLNVSLLCSLAHVRIQWIDVIAPHLEFDKATNTLFLFRYPSYCLSSKVSSSDVALHDPLLW